MSVTTDHPTELRRVRVASIRQVAIDIRSYDLLAADGRPLAPFAAGSHVDVHVPGCFVRQYSLCGDPRVPNRYSIAVKKELAGRGGSASMHDEVEVGSVLGMTGPRNHFPLASHARHSVFIAGGIGITPIYAMIQSLDIAREDWELHYCARSEEHAAFYPELRELSSTRVHGYFSEVPILDTTELLRVRPDSTHLYCCGPQGLMKAVGAAGAHWEEGSVHFEWFAAPATDRGPNRPFEVVLSRSGLVLTVPSDRSILQIVREHGVEVPSACEEGLCGTCETRVLAGDPEHRDMLLSHAERAANCSMMICVSRANSARLELDL